MRPATETILIVDADPKSIDVIAHQALEPAGFNVGVVKSANAALKSIARRKPQLIIANLALPGLSGKDLLVALASVDPSIPVIVVSAARQGDDIIQAFRLGAVDYIYWPAREAEIITVVDRILKQVRAQGERAALAHKLNQTNLELQKRVRQLTTMFAIGKAVTSLTDQQRLFARIVEGAVYLAEADRGWLLLRAQENKKFILRAQLNLPAPLAEKMNHIWDDGLSSLVGLSGEPLAIHGEPLKRFKISHLGNAALVVPIKLKSEIIGLLTVTRQAAQPFSTDTQVLLNGVSDYASISIANSFLFQALEERARQWEQNARDVQENKRLGAHSQEAGLQTLVDRLEHVKMVFSKLSEGVALNAHQQKLLHNIQQDILQMQLVLADIVIDDGRLN